MLWILGESTNLADINEMSNEISNPFDTNEISNPFVGIRSCLLYILSIEVLIEIPGPTFQNMG